MPHREYHRAIPLQEKSYKLYFSGKQKNFCVPRLTLTWLIIKIKTLAAKRIVLYGFINFGEFYLFQPVTRLSFFLQNSRYAFQR